MLIIGLIISVLISICLGTYCFYLQCKKQEIVKINIARQKENEQLEQSNQELKTKRENLAFSIKTQEDALKSLDEARINLEKDAEDRATAAYDLKLKELMAKAKEQEYALAAEYQKKSDSLDAKINQAQEKLNNIEAKQLAYIQAQQRQEEIAANQDYYRLALDKLELDDISLLRELQPRFMKKESIDKLIWEVYFKPAYDVLMSHLFTTSKEVCGIYKLTDLTTGQAYIGQSVNCKERFRQHIKAALTYDKVTNKLYQAMQKSGVHNFTFEILEEVSRDKLNEREVYWIDFYKTKDQLNSTKGGA